MLHELGWESNQISPMRSLVLRAGSSRREFGISYLLRNSQPYIAMAIPIGFSTSFFDKLYSRYLDFDFETVLLFRQIYTETPDVSYLLFHDDARALLYDIESQECIIACSGKRDREDRLYPHLDKSLVDKDGLDDLLRKSVQTLARELAGWTHLWSAELGSKTEAVKRTLNIFMNKLILARFYRNLFGPEVPHLLFEAFLDDPGRIEDARINVSPQRFLTDLFNWFRGHFKLDYFEIKNAENRFLNRAESLDNLLYRFLVEINFISRQKFSLDVIVEKSATERERLLFAKKSYALKKNVLKERFFPSDYMVLKPVEIDLVEDGALWAIYMFEQIVCFWMEYNQTRENIVDQIPSAYQEDMFASKPESTGRGGRIQNIIDYTLKSCIKLKNVRKNAEADRLLFLFIAKSFELWKKYDIPAEPLSHTGNILK